MTSPEPQSPDQRGVPPSALVLIAANLVPLVGVVALHWTVFSILLLYWCENVVVGVFNVLRMLVASPKDVAADAAKVFFIPFFMFHYGMFTMVHGIFVMALFGPGGGRFSPSPAAFLAAVRGAGIGYGALAILLSHGFSFVHNYLASGEFRRASLPQLMAQPYARVMVLHVTILLGGFAAKAMGAPVAALLLLIALKTLIDLRAHLAERKKLGTLSAP
ncbi:MAG TPA: DUF6498-containing protein [Gemmatimonadales bacterium]|nr:DUF6498-containing protein [Gemmatimonadales bacterium]